jgi:hypothetical protein
MRRGDVRAARRPGDRECRDALAREHRGQHAPPEGLAAEREHRRQRDGVRHERGDQPARAGLRELDRGDQAVECVRLPGSAVLGREAEA